MRITTTYNGDTLVLETKADPDLPGAGQTVNVVSGYIETSAGRLIPQLYLQLVPLSIERAGGVQAFAQRILNKWNEQMEAHYQTGDAVPGDDVIAQVESELEKLAFKPDSPFVQFGA